MKASISRPGLRALPFVALLIAPTSPSAQTYPETRSASATVAAETLPDVTITASPLQTPLVDTAQPASVLTGDRLKQRTAPTLGATLAGEPGVHDSGFGLSAGRPVIRGFDGARVGVARNGLDLFDVSASSPDHAVADDPLTLRSVEILRGPATLPYGGSAIGGLVNLVGDEIPASRLDGLSGEAQASVDSGAKGRQAAAALRAGKDGWNWTVSGFTRRSDDYRFPGNAVVGDPASASGRLPNSATRAQGASVGASRVADWGMLGMSHSSYDSRYGIPAEEDVFIRMSRERSELLGEFDAPLPGLEMLRLKYADSRYRHDEVEAPGGEIGTSFRSRGREARIELLHAPIAGLRGAFGLQWRERTLRVSGEEAYLPDNDDAMRALFWVAERRIGKVRLELGARHESTRLRPDGDWGSPGRDFSMNSLSAAATIPLSTGYEASIVLGVAARAPVADELYANGPHAATGTFEIGNPDLPHERSTNLDLSLRKTDGILRWKAGVYANRFGDYLYGHASDVNGDGLADRVDETGAIANAPLSPDAGELLRIEYDRAKARFHGIEAEVVLKPEGSALQWRAFADLARGRIEDGGNLPRMAPARVGLGAEWAQGDWSGFVNWLSVRRQDRIAALETPTDGYQRVDAEIARRVRLSSGAEATLFLQGRNLLDAPIRLHTSFVKDSVPMPGRSLVAGVRARF